MAGPTRADVKEISDLLTNANKVAGIDNPLLTSANLVDGVDPIAKFGHCSSATLARTDAWELGDTIPVYVFPDAAGENITIESSNATDTQSIVIQGLDENGIEVSISVALTGDSPAAVSGLFTAVNRAYNESSTRFIGNVSIKGAVSGNTFAYIDADEQQTTQCIYVTPSDKYIALNNLSSAINRSGNQDASSLVFLSVQLPNGVFRTQIRYGLQKRGTSHVATDLAVPPFYPPGTKIKVSFQPDTADMDVSAYFSGLLIDADLYESLLAE